MCFLPLLPFFTCWLRVLLFPWLFAFFSALDLSTLLISFLWLSITVWGQFLLSLVPFTCSLKLYKPYFYENYFYLQESLPLCFLAHLVLFLPHFFLFSSSRFTQLYFETQYSILLMSTNWATTWIHFLTLMLTSFVALGSLTSLCFIFLTCKLRYQVVPVSKGCVKIKLLNM